jgi:hypothetical protein
MNSEPWVVKTGTGAIWGKIHRVIIDSTSRQIVSADVMLDGTGQFMRVPWTSLQIRDDDIVLGTSETDIHTTMQPSEGRVPDTVTLEESASPYHV